MLDSLIKESYPLRLLLPQNFAEELNNISLYILFVLYTKHLRDCEPNYNSY